MSPPSTQAGGFASFNPNIHQEPQSSQSSNQPQNSYQNQANHNQQGLHCNIVVNLQNAQNFNEQTARQHMVLLAAVLESYESLMVGRIGNP